MLTHASCARYGLIGLPLAFAAIPLYVVLPAHYGQQLGVPLALLGVVLLITRFADALIDPLLGRWVDRLLGQPGAGGRWMAFACVMLVLGFVAVFFPQVSGESALLWWCGLTVMFTFLAYSLATVLHLAWGTRLGGERPQRARLVAWREGCGLVGVVTANVLATQAGPGWTAAALAATLAVGVLWLKRGPQPEAASVVAPGPDAAVSLSGVAPLNLPWQGEGFRRLMAVFLLNGIASAIPATLVLFFIQDRLDAMAYAPAFLGGYFLVAALSVPWWVRCMTRLGPMAAWALGMCLSVAGFAGVLTLEMGDVAAFGVICLVTGWALGADLTAPGTLLAGVVQRAGHHGQAEGAYAGWWHWATKLNLALAAGVALPALQWLGYSPGARDPEALQALTLAYGVLPCVFKLAALAACWRWRRHAALA